MAGTTYFFNPQDRTPAYPIAVMPAGGLDRIAGLASGKQGVALKQAITLDTAPARRPHIGMTA